MNPFSSTRSLGSKQGRIALSTGPRQLRRHDARNLVDGVNDVTSILNAIRQGDARAGAALMPAVYPELRKIAGAKMAREQSGQTRQPTALVHEAWRRLGEQTFENRAHFFSAAAEAIRRVMMNSFPR